MPPKDAKSSGSGFDDANNNVFASAGEVVVEELKVDKIPKGDASEGDASEGATRGDDIGLVVKEVLSPGGGIPTNGVKGATDGTNTDEEADEEADEDEGALLSFVGDMDGGGLAKLFNIEFNP